MSVLIKGLLNPFPFRPTHLPHSPIVLNLLVPFQSWVDFITGIDQRLAVLQTPLLSFLASTGKFEPQALLSTDLTFTPEQILDCFRPFLWKGSRWQMEPTFRHVRTHLGVETQRQWSDKAIARTTPSLLGLFSFITLLADTLLTQETARAHSTAWYPKRLLTFSDAFALVRHPLWAFWTFHLSYDELDLVKVPRPLLARFNDLLCYAA
jgi:hypothetical protein